MRIKMCGDHTPFDTRPYVRQETDPPKMGDYSAFIVPRAASPSTPIGLKSMLMVFVSWRYRSRCIRLDPARLAFRFFDWICKRSQGFLETLLPSPSDGFRSMNRLKSLIGCRVGGRIEK